MRRTVLLLVSTVAAGAIIGPQSAGAATTVKCKLPPVDGAGFYDLKVRSASCSTGKELLRRVEAGKTTNTDSDGYRFTVKVRNRTWRCSVAFPGYEQARHSCRNGTGRIWLRSGA